MFYQVVITASRDVGVAVERDVGVDDAPTARFVDARLHRRADDRDDHGAFIHRITDVTRPLRDVVHPTVDAASARPRPRDASARRARPERAVARASFGTRRHPT